MALEHRGADQLGRPGRAVLLYHDNNEPIDFMYQEMIGNLEWECEHPEIGYFKIDYNAPDRDGMYEQNQMFAIYDEKDVKMLIHKLNSLLK